MDQNALVAGHAPYATKSVQREFDDVGQHTFASVAPTLNDHRRSGRRTFADALAASRTVHRLVRDGWVRRVENPTDRRQKVLTLTPEGVALMEDIEGKLTAGIEYLAARLAPEEQEQFRRLIARMVAANCTEEIHT
ncbi:MAG: MarR family transcriptional regulator [Caldilineaceae bacterium]